MRLDKFLKVSRLIKRRTIANEACDAGRVLVNGKQAKASLNVKVGDIIEIAWKDTVPSIVYPLNKKWISKKVLCYVVVSIVAFFAFCIVIASIGGING